MTTTLSWLSGCNGCFLTCIWFLRRQVKWSSIPISLRIFQFVVIHTIKGFFIVNEAEVDVLLEFSCFFYDSVHVGNLISGSSAFSKSSLNTWKFTVHILLKPSLENFEPYFASVWDECNCAVVWTCFGIAFLCGILARWPGIEPAPTVLEGKVLTTRPPGKSPLLPIGDLITF